MKFRKVTTALMLATILTTNVAVAHADSETPIRYLNVTVETNNDTTVETKAAETPATAAVENKSTNLPKTGDFNLFEMIREMVSNYFSK